MTEQRMQRAILAAVAAAIAATPAQAEMVLSKVILDIPGGRPARDDIEVWNDGPERIYVVAEPSEIVEPGTIAQRRESAADPSVSGLLVSPQRMILEPGQRRLMRVATILPRDDRDRVYRVTIKPVAGPLSARGDAIKVYVGYDVLVIQRPASISGQITGVRTAGALRIANGTNTAWELFDGKQCDATGRNCIALPATRLYAGADLEVKLPYDTKVEYRTTNGVTTLARQF